MVEKGKVRAIEREGNDISDACVAEGVKCGGVDERLIARFYNRRQKD